MRIWDLPTRQLCRKHLLGEHRELHAIWSILTLNKKGYLNHPETKRWVGKLPALYERHEQEIKEMTQRGYKHNSDLNQKGITGETKQFLKLNTLDEQRQILKHKGCECKLNQSLS